MNEADEMNLYSPNPILDSPFGISDLEWLYRQQDVDGATLTSRLSQLAPISFTNTIDGLRRRRLFSTDSWESNGFAWSNDNPGNTFQYNSRFAVGVNASTQVAGTYTPSLAHRDRKINLNYPLPVSNDCNEPIRQKWISDTYQILKWILPPDSIDTAEERAQLSQFVINIIDFRDPDATMTHWVNPDVWMTPSTNALAYPTLNLASLVPCRNPWRPPRPVRHGVQPGRDQRSAGLRLPEPDRHRHTSTAKYTNRFFIELVNTLTAAYNPTYDYGTPTDPHNYYGYGPLPESPPVTGPATGGNIPGPTTPPYQASVLDLGGFDLYPERSLLRRHLGPGLPGRYPRGPSGSLPWRGATPRFRRPPITACSP